MTFHRKAASRLWTGSGILSRRILGWITTWIARSRRRDLTGWKASVGPVLRTLAVLLAAYAIARILRALPGLLWLLTPAWAVTALCMGSATPTGIIPNETTDTAPEPPLNPRTGFLLWLLDIIEDRPGIHLRELYPAMRELPGQQGHDDVALRARLRALGITVERSMRVGTVAGRSGIRRTTVEALLPRTETTTGDQHGDAGQDADSPLLSVKSPTMESA